MFSTNMLSKFDTTSLLRNDVFLIEAFKAISSVDATHISIASRLHHRLPVAWRWPRGAYDEFKSPTNHVQATVPTLPNGLLHSSNSAASSEMRPAHKIREGDRELTASQPKRACSELGSKRAATGAVRQL